MNTKKILGITIVFALIVLMFFTIGGALRTPHQPAELAGVILTPPPGYLIIPHENTDNFLSLKQIANELDKILKQHPEEKKICLKYTVSGKDSFVLVDLTNDVVQKMAANATGTMVQTTWKRNVNERIRWCQLNGNFTPEGMTDSVSRNLYH